MPDCPAIQPHLTAYRHGELPADRAAAVRAHLAACPSCQAELAELATTEERLAAALAPVLAAVQPLATAQREALLARAAELDAAPRRRPWLLLQPRWLARVAATVAVAGLVGLIVRESWRENRAAPAAAQEQVPEATAQPPAELRRKAEAQESERGGVGMMADLAEDTVAPAEAAAPAPAAPMAAPIAKLAASAESHAPEAVSRQVLAAEAATMATGEAHRVAAPAAAPAPAPTPAPAPQSSRKPMPPAPVVAAPAPPPPLPAASGLAAAADAAPLVVEAPAFAAEPALPSPVAPTTAAPAPAAVPALSVALVLRPPEQQRREVQAGDAGRAEMRDAMTMRDDVVAPPVPPILSAHFGANPREPDAVFVRVVAESARAGAPLPLRLELLVPPTLEREVVEVARWSAPGRAVLVARVRPAALAARLTARVAPQPGEAPFTAREVACQAVAADDAGFRADLTQAELRARAGAP